MGTSADAVITDKLGRRSGPRRKYSILEKRAMVEATHVRGSRYRRLTTLSQKSELAAATATHSRAGRR